MHRDEPADVVQEQFAAAMFPDHPLGREVLGEPEIVRKVTVPAIRSFFEDHYRPGNMVIAAAGDLDHDRLAQGIEARFAGRHGGRPPVREAPSGETIPLVVESRDTEQAQLVLGVRAPDRRSPDRFTMAVLNHILGGGLSSRLFQEIREARGLAYSIGSDRSAYDDAGSPCDLGRHRARARPRGARPAAHRAGPSRRQGDHAPRARGGQGSPPRRPAAVARGLRRPHVAHRRRAVVVRRRCSASRSCSARVAAVSADQVRAVAEQVLTGARTLAVVGPFAASDFE